MAEEALCRGSFTVSVEKFDLKQYTFSIGEPVRERIRTNYKTGDKES